MIKKIMMLGLLAAFLATTTFASAEDVYKTKNGAKYHKQDCRLIKNKNAVKIDKAEAIKAGLKPCKKCFSEEVSDSSKK